MSGFLGMVSLDGTPADPVLLGRMTAAMAYRGPDGCRSWLALGVGFGHALLRSTSEGESEEQPASLDGETWIVADARLDDRDTLASSLRAHGRSITPHAPDPDLILHAYAAWGERCLDHLSGDFAFGIWDARQRRLFCARDPFGVAQLFYIQIGETLLFGNTLQALFLYPGVSPTLDEQAVADFALFDYFLDPDTTAYSAIRRLPQGQRLTWSTAGLRTERYWSPPVHVRPLRCRNPQEYVEQFRIVFDRAVADRLRTDRVGCQLSGGMDSTSIAATAYSLLKAGGKPCDFRAYTIVYEQLLQEEEGPYAGQVAAYCGFPVERVVAEQHFQNVPPSAPTWLPPEPSLLSAPPELEIVKRVNRFARVLLVGLGGDPALNAPPFSWSGAWAALGQGEWGWPLRCARRAWGSRRRASRATLLPPWIHPRLADRMDLRERIDQLRRPSYSQRVGMAEAPLWRAFFAWSDPGASGFPLRVRFPFFDQKLFEFILTLPPAPWCERKQILRRAMEGRLPPAVLTRPKTGLPGNPWHVLHEQTGIPDWKLELLAVPEMHDIVDGRWLDHMARLPRVQQAAAWAATSPPINLAYWLQHRHAATG